MTGPAAAGPGAPSLGALLAPHLERLVALRRDVHAHPETAHVEHRTTAVVAQLLREAGLHPRLLPGTGLVCDVGEGERAVALRADLDALPLADETSSPFASTVEGVAHACGHDVHTAVVAGAGVLLADLARAGRLPGRVRLVFQPAEEATPGGALDVLAAGGVDGVERIFAVHCDPHTDVGRVGLRVGPITSAFDRVLVRLRGPGGHTSRPHLTGDLVFALGKVVTEVPAVLSRRLDPRAGVSMVWGRVSAGGAANAIPRLGVAEGTLRCVRADAWAAAGEMFTRVVEDVVEPYGVSAEVELLRGVPPVVNDAVSTGLLEHAAATELGEGAAVPTDQSLGGEDFAWYLERLPGAMARLGTRTPGGPTHDLHRGDFEPDERAIAVGARLLAATATTALHEPAQPVTAAGRAGGVPITERERTPTGPRRAPAGGPTVQPDAARRSRQPHQEDAT
ncbi:amidohydrolase [Quadrisphaera sp. DSM 44207]|uniref:amidohydrolase n=1 Tax=Quadrisphaera sp. DSM 44207 TaxID=1881057 RepID=UPI00087E080B|nr:amidohydrolase [Quadrisphaera sp. DSM 44207]SDQ11964.1 amidohydrolase [Quadrisphaera sp. DSM 44207]